jgi:hypothetical protein
MPKSKAIIVLILSVSLGASSAFADTPQPATSLMDILSKFGSEVVAYATSPERSVIPAVSATLIGASTFGYLLGRRAGWNNFAAALAKTPIQMKKGGQELTFASLGGTTLTEQIKILTDIFYQAGGNCANEMWVKSMNSVK